MKKEIVSKAETVPSQIGLKIVFADKDFKSAWTIEFRDLDIERYKKFDKEYFARVWEQYSGNGIASILRLYPKKWKHYSDYEKKFEKVMKKKIADNEKLLKKGKPLMGKKEWRKGIPVFESTIKPDDIRAVVVGKNCFVRTFVASYLTAETLKKLIDKL